MVRVGPCFKLLVVTILLCLGVALGVSCGPSIRRTHQSDNAFARCFDMDYMPEALATDKEICWKTWLSKHVYNQPGDKKRYANLRLDELAKGISVPGPPGPPGRFDERPKAGADGGVEESAPSSSSKRSKVLVTSESAEKQTCLSDCELIYHTCHNACLTDAGPETHCASACEKSRGACEKLCEK